MQLPIEFQQETSGALKDAAKPCPAQVHEQSESHCSRRFNIYRNNRAISLIESLQEMYPAIRALVGDAFFNAVARDYIDLHPPQGPVLAEYGDLLGEFIQKIPASAKVPYLADVAAIEWAWQKAYHAQDIQPLPFSYMASVEEDKLAELRFRMHPSLSFIQSRWPVGSLWSACTADQVNSANIDMGQSEQVVILRPEFDVTVMVLPTAGGVFLEAQTRGCTLEHAVTLASEYETDFNVGAHLNNLFELGVYADVYTEKE